MVTHLKPYGGRAFSHLGTSIVFKQEPRAEEDVFLFEMRMPAGNGVPPHTERNKEAFYVLEGALEVEADGQRHRWRPASSFPSSPAFCTRFTTLARNGCTP